MDIKNAFESYDAPCGIDNCNIENVKKSIQILTNSNIDYEFRTTIVKEYHTIDSILNILKEIGSVPNYYLQNFEDSEYVHDHSLHGFSKEELITMQELLRKTYPNVEVRNL